MEMSPRGRRASLAAAASAALLAITLTACADGAPEPLSPAHETEVTVLPITDAQLAGGASPIW